MKKHALWIATVILLQAGCTMFTGFETSTVPLSEIPSQILPQIKIYLPDFKPGTKPVEVYASAGPAIDRVTQYGIQGELGGREVMVMFSPEVGMVTIQDMKFAAPSPK